MLGLSDARLVGIDVPIHADPHVYNSVVNFIKTEPMARGALVTTHKIDLYVASHGQFDRLGNAADLMKEISCISKNDHSLVGEALDPITGGLAIDEVVDPTHWADTDSEIAFLGAGGSTIAISWYLAQRSRGSRRPGRIVVTNRSIPRLEAIQRIHHDAELDVAINYVHTPDPVDNDAVVASLSARSVVVNATGLGKDVPGSPVTNNVAYPDDAIAWDLNYRGDLLFLDQARAAGATAVDGWSYFLHGWSQHIGRVFGIDTPSSGSRFSALKAIAEEGRTQ